MALALVVFGLFVSALPTLGRRAGRRLRAREWAQLSVAGLVVGVAMVEMGLVLLALPTMLRSLGVEAFAAACGRAVAPLVPFGQVGGWAAAALAAVTAVLALRERRRLARTRARTWIERGIGEHHRDQTGIEMVVLPTSEWVAYSVASPSPQIVVTSGLVSALTDAELEIVVDHEKAHLRHGHHQVLCVAAVAAAALVWWRPASWSGRVVSTAFERWADEATVGADTRRRLRLVRVLGHLALAPPLPAVALSPAHTVAERIRALETCGSPRSRGIPGLVRAVLYLPGAAAVVAATGALSVWVTQAQFVLALAGRCPLQG